MPEANPIKVAVFDLNKTVYNKSSKEEFFKFICYRRNYKLLDIFQLSLYTVLRQLKISNKTEWKENFFSYLDHLPPEQVKEFAWEFWSVEWPKHFNSILLQRIRELHEAGVLVIFITGGLDVYVEPLFENFLVPDKWIATKTQYYKGSHIIIGKACKDEEKVRRLQQVMDPQPFEIVESYSDQKEPVLMAAQKPFLIKEREIIPCQK